MTHNKFLNDKSNKNWEAYRKQRNLVTKLKSNQLEHISIFSFIILILGCSLADKLLSLPISFATFMKKLLKLFAT
jgi:hypothetical protein